MIRLELQISTVSLVSYSTVLIPLVPSGLAFYLGFGFYTQHLLRVSTILTAVFLLLLSLSFFLTALLVIPTRTILITTNGLPFLGVIITGSVWFCTRISTPGLGKSQIEPVCFIFWIASLVASAMALVYTIMQYKLIEQHMALSEVAEATEDSPEKYSQNESVRGHRHNDSYQTINDTATYIGTPNGSPNKNLLSFFSPPKFDSLKPSFRAHHQSDSSFGFSDSAYKLCQVMHSHNNSFGSGISPYSSPLNDLGEIPSLPNPKIFVNEPRILPKQRKGSGLTNGIKNISNNIRKFSNAPAEDNNQATRSTGMKTPNSGFDGWDINSVKSKLFLSSSASNLDSLIGKSNQTSPCGPPSISGRSDISQTTSSSVFIGANDLNHLLSPAGFARDATSPGRTIDSSDDDFYSDEEYPPGHAFLGPMFQEPAITTSGTTTPTSRFSFQENDDRTFVAERSPPLMPTNRISSTTSLEQVSRWVSEHKEEEEEEVFGEYDKERRRRTMN